MAVIREGNRGVLLVVAVQVAVMRYAWDAPRIIQNISFAVQKVRGRGKRSPLVRSSPIVTSSPQIGFVKLASTAHAIVMRLNR